MTSTVVFTMGAIILAVALVAPGVVALSVILRRESSPPTGTGEAPEPLALRVAELEIKVAELPSLWEHERARAERAADSARKARKSAEKKLAKIADDTDDEFEGDIRDFPPLDALRGDNGAVQHVLPGLGGATTPDLMARARAVGYPFVK